ncbi:MAG: hypothetical protein ACJAVM_002964 [Sulfitobacter sp.]|jgi:hypothetical protein
MEIILTGAQGNLAYWAKNTPRQTRRAFGFQGRFNKHQSRSFAGLSAFGANSNHAPSGYDGAVNPNIAFELLFRIAGQS